MTLGIARLYANPTVIEAQDAYLRLIGEDVRVNAGKQVAEVDGDYDFTLIAEAVQPNSETYYRFQLPVYCDTKDMHLDRLSETYRPKLSINNVRYEFKEVHPFALPSESKVPDLIRPLICFEAKVPRSVGKRFLAHISYIQPYFEAKGTRVFAYLPIIFDAPEGSASARGECQLRLAPGKDVTADPKTGRWKRTGNTFIFECRHFQEIVVGIH